MGFNRIMNTILKFRRLAANNELDRFIFNNYQKYNKLIQRRKDFEKLSDEDRHFIDLFEAKWEERNEDPGNFIDDKTKPEFIQNEDGTIDYNFRNTRGKSLFDSDQVVQRFNGPLDDILKEIIINPFFPHILRKRVERNTFNDQDCKNEMDRIRSYLKDNEELYKRFNDEIAKVQAIIKHHDNVTRRRNNTQTKIDHINIQIKNIKDKIQQLKQDNEVLNNQLDEPQIDDDGDEFTYREQYEAFGNDMALFNLYEVGNSLNDYQKKLKEVNDEHDRNAEILENMKGTQAENTGDYNNIEKRIERLDVQIGVLNRRAVVANAIIANKPEYMSKDEYGDDMYDYIEAVYANKQLIDYTSEPGQGPKENLLPNVVTDNKGHHINWAWEDIKTQMPDIIDIKERIDTVDNNDAEIGELRFNYNTMIQDLKKYQREYDNDTRILEQGTDKYQAALQRTEEQDYKDRAQEVTEYIGRQDYLKRLERAYNEFAKGPKNNKAIPDENNEIRKVKAQISADEDYITINRAAYEKAKSVSDGTRSYKDNRLIQMYDEAVKRHSSNRQKLYNLERTNSEKLQTVDVSKIDYKKIADKIIKQLAEEKSLLGILLTQSIDKFVAYYLANNNFQAPDLSSKIRLLHYFMGNEPEENVRLKDLADFQDSSKNMDLLKSICSVLMKESKNNIMDKFLSIIKSDFKEVYDACDLNIINSTDLFYVDEETQGKIIRQGPYTVSELKQILGFDKNPSIGDKKTIAYNGRKITVQIIEDNLTGNQIYELLNGDRQKDVQILFEKVKNEIIEYIREELQYKSYEICKNPGNNFYGVVLAQSVQEVVAENINYDQLADWLTSTKKKKTQEWNKNFFNQTVNQFRDDIIQQLCEDFNTDNEYEMFVKFLQTQGVHNSNMIKAKRETNVDYYKRLEKIYAEPFKSFMFSLERIIKRRVTLCKKELQIRDKDQYADLISQDRSDEEQRIYNELNGYTNEDGEQVPGLIERVSTSNREINNQQKALYDALIAKARTIKGLENVDESFIKKLFDSTIISLLHGNEDINQYILKYEPSTTGKGRSQQKIDADDKAVRILQLLQSDKLIAEQVKKYKSGYQEYLKLLKECKKNQNYIEVETKNRNTNTNANNSLITELIRLYTTLYGTYNPLAAALKKVREEDNITKSNKNLTDSEMQKRNEIMKRIEQNIEYLDENKFIDMLNNTSGTWQRAGLYGKVINYNKQIKELQQTHDNIKAQLQELLAKPENDRNIDKINDLAKNLQTCENTLQERIKERNELNNNIATCRQRIQVLENTGRTVLNQENALIASDDRDEDKDVANAAKQHSQLELYTILHKFSLNRQDKNKDQADIQLQNEVEKQEQEAFQQTMEKLMKSKNENTYEYKQQQRKKHNEEIDESRNAERSLRSNEGEYRRTTNPDEIDIDQDINYNEMMYLYWTNPDQLGDLLLDIDKYDAIRWVRSYIANPDSIDPEYAPPKERIRQFIRYDEKMKLYWDNPGKFSKLSLTVDKNEANKWMQKYIENPNSISHQEYVPSEKAIKRYKLEQAAKDKQ